MKKIVALICLIALILSMSAMTASAAGDWFDYERTTDPDYSFAVIGDIQTLAWYDQRVATTYTQTLFDWILNNKESRKIEYVFGLGDTIETLSSWDEGGYNTSVTNPGEWRITSTQIARLNGTIPYLVVRGNHDDEAGYHEYICTDDYKDQMTGFFCDETGTEPGLNGNSLSNSYRKIRIGTQKYLMLALDFDINDDVIEWANNIISENYDHKVIVAVHAYNSGGDGFLKGNIGQPGEDDETDGDANHDFFYFNGERLWDEIFSKHKNMLMVLNGHVSVTDPVINTRKAENGNTVFEILVDPQAHDDNLHQYGDGAGAFVMLLNFSNNGKTIEIEYISTTRDKHYKERNQKVLTVPEIDTNVHRHSYGDWMPHNDTHHKQLCECQDAEYAPHEWDEGEVTLEPTHLKEGEKLFNCTVCGATKTEAVAKLIKHEYGEWSKHNETLHAKKCACGGIEYEDHAWSKAKVTKEATAEAEGEKTSTCSVCGETKVEKIDKLAATKKSGCKGSLLGGSAAVVGCITLFGAAFVTRRKKIR